MAKWRDGVKGKSFRGFSFMGGGEQKEVRELEATAGGLVQVQCR